MRGRLRRYGRYVGTAKMNTFEIVDSLGTSDIRGSSFLFSVFCLFHISMTISKDI